MTGEGAAQVRKGDNGRGRGAQKLWGVGEGKSHHSPSATAPLPPMPPRRSMDFRTPDLLEMWLEPPEDVFSTGSFLELGLHGPPSEVPVTRLQEQGLQGWESSGGHGFVSVMNGSGCGLRQLCDKKSKRLQLPLRERSEDRAPKIDMSCNYPHVQGQKGLKLKHEGSSFDVR